MTLFFITYIESVKILTVYWGISRYTYRGGVNSTPPSPPLFRGELDLQIHLSQFLSSPKSESPCIILKFSSTSPTNPMQTNYTTFSTSEMLYLPRLYGYIK